MVDTKLRVAIFPKIFTTFEEGKHGMMNRLLKNFLNFRIL